MSTEYFLPKFTVHSVGDIETLSQIYPQNIRSFNIPRLWAKTKGKGIMVALLDTGIQTHPDLVKNIDLSKSKSFIDGEGIFDDTVFHGLHVGGIIASENNEFGVVGVAPETTLVSIKVLNKNGQSQNRSVERGLEYCLSLNPDIINMSLGNKLPMPETYELIKKLIAKNIIIICSSGNNGETDDASVLYPAKYEECIAVGSSSQSMQMDRSLFSSYGMELDLLAPGEQILSTYGNGTYGVLSGSSMAAPFVTGIVALLLSYYKGLNKTISVEDVRKLLLTTASDIGKKGFDKESGWGIVDPDKLFSSLPNGIAIKKPSIWQKIKSIFNRK